MTSNRLEGFKNWIQERIVQPPAKIQRGVYSFRRELSGTVSRFHLRVDEDGSGMLLANSSVAARLTPSGVLIARALLENRTDVEVRAIIKRTFRNVSERQLDSDIKKLREFINTLAGPDGNYPVFNLDDPALAPPRNLFAPFHAQLPVAAGEQLNPILKKLWDAGIAHVTFSARKNATAENCIRNVERAEDLGMICGVRATGTWFKTPELLHKIAFAGVDYITVPVASHESAQHNGILGNGDFENAHSCFEECNKLEVCPVAEVPIWKGNLNSLETLLDNLGANGIRNVQYFAIAAPVEGGLSATEIIQAAVNVDDLSSRSVVRYVWLPPVSRNATLNEIVIEGPRAAGDVSVSIEEDGSVYPPRGPNISGGNLLSESWETIWNREPFARYRERVESATHCSICPGLEICAADCPAEPKGWDQK